MDLLLGHSPDPDDAFMFYALAENKIDTGDYRFQHILQDIETLNQRALRGELHISAVSIHASDVGLLGASAQRSAGNLELACGQDDRGTRLKNERLSGLPTLHRSRFNGSCAVRRNLRLC